jgi:WD40 repeat protein
MMKIYDLLANLSDEQREYAITELPGHCVQSGDTRKLLRFLLDFDFMEAKIFSLPPDRLIDDYELALQSDLQTVQNAKKSLKLIQSAIQLADTIVIDDPSQLAGQLLGHLLSFQEPEIQSLNTQIQEQNLGYPWLRPLTPSLTPAAGPLLRTLDGHRDWVKAVAIAREDGKIAVSGSDDCTLRVWNLQTGAELSRLTGHDD